MKTTVEKLQPEDRLSYSFRVTTDKDQFLIPVIDIRDGEKYEKRIKELEADSNRVRGSKFIKQSFSGIGISYNENMRKRNKK